MDGRDIWASIRHGFGNILRFSGRDPRRQFRPYAVFLAMLHGAVLSTFMVAQMALVATDRIQRAIERHPEGAHRIELDFSVKPGFEPLSIALCTIAAFYLLLIAAALVRRRHDRDRIETAAALAFPAALIALAMAPNLVPYTLVVVWLGAIAYALIRGGAPERIIAAIVILGTAVSLAIALVVHAGGQTPVTHIGMPIVSAIGSAIIVAIALRADRYWPIWFAGLGGMALILDIAHLLKPDMPDWVYLTAGPLFGYPMVLALIIGTRAHRIRLKRDGVDPAWVARSAGRA